MELSITRSDQKSLLLSFLLHVGLLAVLIVMGTSTYQRPAEKTLTWIELDPVAAKKSESLSRRMVQTKLVEKSKDTTPDAFLGEQTQKVHRETVSLNRSNKGGAAAQPTQTQKAQTQVAATAATKTTSNSKVQVIPLSQFGLAMQPKAAERKPATLQEVTKEASKDARVGRESRLSEAGTNSPQDYVEGIRESDQTALNTREFTYFGYFERIRDRLDLAWQKNLRSRITKLYYSGRRLASEFDHKTQVLVSLSSTGDVTRVQLVEGSGTVDLDDAAVQAFREAGPFPNPPKGLLGNANQIDVRWEFVLRS